MSFPQCGNCNRKVKTFPSKRKDQVGWRRRGKEWHEPYRVDSKFMEVIELLFQPLKITDAIPVAGVESAHVHLIDDRVLDILQLGWTVYGNRGKGGRGCTAEFEPFEG